MAAVEGTGGRLRLACSGVFLCVALAACSNASLDQVQAFAKTVGASIGVFAAIANDFYSSCTRQYYWRFAAARDTSDYPSLDQLCGTSQQTAQLWQKTSMILLAYAKAMGDLAGGTQASADYGIPKLVDEVLAINTTVKVIDAKPAQVLGGLSTWIVKAVKAAFAEKRKEAAAEFGDQADAYVQEIVLALQKVAFINYRGHLGDETTALANFSKTVPLPPPGLERLLMAEKVDSETQILEDRQMALTAYVDLLGDISKAHAALVRSLNYRTTNDAARIAQSALADAAVKLAVLARTLPH